MAPNPPVDTFAAEGKGNGPANGTSATGPAKGSSAGTNAADTPADATKRVRTSKPKVKTGCSNCKQRRIKCDEKRPACSQCVKSKKECTGYPPPPRGSKPFEEIAIAPKPILMAAAPAIALAPGPALAARPTRPTPGPAPLAAAPRPLAAVKTAGPQPFPLSQSLLPTESAYAQAYRQPLQPQPISNAQSQSQSQSQSYPMARAKQFQAQVQEQGQEQEQALSASRQVAQIPRRRAQKLQQRRNAPPNIPIAAIAAASGATFLYLPSINLPFTEQEGNYFQLFRSQTANELSGFFDDVFWSRLVLAECHSEAAIRHAVVALGALYKTLETSTESPPTSPADPNYNSHDNARGHWQVALKQYAEACHELRITDRDDERTQRTRLMASVLLACFDSFIGHHKHAIIQIQTGLGLLHQLRVQRRAVLADPSTASEPVESELMQMFTRLAIQAKSYDMAFHFPQPYVIQLLSAGPAGGSTTSSPSDPMAAAASSSTSPPPAAAAAPVTPLPTSTHQRPIPDQFTTLREARLSWDSLLERIFRFMEYMLQHANGPPHLLPQSMKSYGYEFKMHMDAWSNAFDPLLANRSSPGVTSQEKAGIAVLKMFQVMGLILYAMTFSDSEMMFDAYQQQFKTIVDLANEVVGDEERRAAAARCRDPTQCAHLHSHVDAAPDANSGHSGHSEDDARHFFEYRTSHIKASFSADLGIVPPLYVVATKSRDRVLRRQAIQLLRSSARREGMWDSELAARIAMWVVAIEEEGEEAEFYEALQRYGHVGGGGGGSGSVRSGSSGLGSPMSPPAFMQQPQLQQQQPPPSVSRGSSVDFGAIPLGPGGNARWDTRRASQASVLHTTNSQSAHGANSASTSPRDLASQPSVPLASPLASPPIVPPPASVSAFSHITAPLDPSIPYFMQTQFPIPAEKRILVKTCEFDLREHTATLKCGTRGLAAGVLDAKTRETEIRW